MRGRWGGRRLAGERRGVMVTESDLLLPLSLCLSSFLCTCESRSRPATVTASYNGRLRPQPSSSTHEKQKHSSQKSVQLARQPRPPGVVTAHSGIRTLVYLPFLKLLSDSPTVQPPCRPWPRPFLLATVGDTLAEVEAA